MDKKTRKDVTSIEPREIGEILFKKTKELFDFSESKVINIIKNVGNPTQKEKALKSIYYRMFLLFKSLTVLNKNCFYQSIASATRSLLEMYIDLKLIIDDQSGLSVKKFFLFYDVEKLRVARNLEKFYEDNKIKNSQRISEIFPNDKNKIKIIENETIRYWGKRKNNSPNFPNHWTNKIIRKRTHDAGFKYEKHYYEIYSLLSWLIHSTGELVTWNYQERQFNTLFLLLHDQAQKIFKEATILFAKELQIDKAWESENTTFFSFLNNIDNNAEINVLYLQIKKKNGK